MNNNYNYQMQQQQQQQQQSQQQQQRGSNQQMNPGGPQQMHQQQQRGGNNPHHPSNNNPNMYDQSQQQQSYPRSHSQSTGGQHHPQQPQLQHQSSYSNQQPSSSSHYPQQQQQQSSYPPNTNPHQPTHPTGGGGGRPQQQSQQSQPPNFNRAPSQTNVQQYIHFLGYCRSQILTTKLTMFESDTPEFAKYQTLLRQCDATSKKLKEGTPPDASMSQLIKDLRAEFMAGYVQQQQRSNPNQPQQSNPQQQQQLQQQQQSQPPQQQRQPSQSSIQQQPQQPTMQQPRQIQKPSPPLQQQPPPMSRMPSNPPGAPTPLQQQQQQGNFGEGLQRQQEKAYANQMQQQLAASTREIPVQARAIPQSRILDPNTQQPYVAAAIPIAANNVPAAMTAMDSRMNANRNAIVPPPTTTTSNVPHPANLPPHQPTNSTASVSSQQTAAMNAQPPAYHRTTSSNSIASNQATAVSTASGPTSSGGGGASGAAASDSRTASLLRQVLSHLQRLSSDQTFHVAKRMKLLTNMIDSPDCSALAVPLIELTPSLADQTSRPSPPLINSTSNLQMTPEALARRKAMYEDTELVRASWTMSKRDTYYVATLIDSQRLSHIAFEVKLVIPALYPHEAIQWRISNLPDSNEARVPQQIFEAMTNLVTQAIKTNAGGGNPPPAGSSPSIRLPVLLNLIKQAGVKLTQAMREKQQGNARPPTMQQQPSLQQRPITMSL